MSVTPPTAAGEALGFSAPQRQRLRAAGGTAALAVLGFLLTLAGLAALLAVKLREPQFASRGQLFLIVPLAAFWLWRLAPGFRQAVRIWRDLRDERQAWVEGPVHCDFKLGIGVVKTVTYTARVAGWQGTISQADSQHLQPGAGYRVYFAPHSLTFLGAAPLVPPPSDQPNAGSASAPPAADAAGPLPDLTQREIELLRLVAAGHSNKEIATRLSLSTNTVKMYNSVIYEKLGVRRRTEAVARARALGLL